MLSFSVYKNENTSKWVTFIHGAGGSSSIWFQQFRAFKKEFNILLIDLSGHGKSKSRFSENRKWLLCKYICRVDCNNNTNELKQY